MVGSLYATRNRICGSPIHSTSTCAYDKRLAFWQLSKKMARYLEDTKDVSPNLVQKRDQHNITVQIPARVTRIFAGDKFSHKSVNGLCSVWKAWL